MAEAKAKTDKGPKRTPRTEKPRGRRKTVIGYVVSDKMQKTIVVELEDRVKHPLYGKIIRTTKKVKAHDENGDAGIGDRVSLMETRPLSATKRAPRRDPREGEIGQALPLFTRSPRTPIPSAAGAFAWSLWAFGPSFSGHRRGEFGDHRPRVRVRGTGRLR